MGYMWADAFRECHLFYNHDSVIEFLLTGASSFGRTSPDDHFQKKGPLTFPCSVGSNISGFTNSIVLIEVNSLHSLSSQLSHIATLPLSLFFSRVSIPCLPRTHRYRYYCAALICLVRCSLRIKVASIEGV